MPDDTEDDSPVGGRGWQTIDTMVFKQSLL